MFFPVLDLIALICFFVCWIGYTSFARRKAKTTNCIARCLQQHRIYWMNELIRRDVRVGDAALLANLERNITFFASTTILVLAGVLTLFAQVDKLESVIATIPFTGVPNHTMIQLKLTLLTFIFVMAFFQFTWSMRQYGFLNVMVGASPVDKLMKDDRLKSYAIQMAIVQDQAAHSYNYGLRAYYFAMAVLSWFFHPILFIGVSLFVVYTLYQREFNSKAVIAITVGMQVLNEHNKRGN
ncbi:DUF599 domain-containing protein [Shewanella sp. D64]|uniref:DUF599 domain-containing protein n=1 Tax=unclassified Shewanella TaxID=196818 RepID=UPI0022BA3F21|nr:MULTISPECIES: DUF599 domain-containing protein [unclassified Shewanella]MEC4727697.1 DUF599 domain-containing protein [Shewanella sp. D64]MEC4739730.1 DUF599 domain-containing protein [Shewanella sp. E94]WBJ98235.1 DUF599 domain-containing protein [Shewanella sp. MTB7]